MKAPLRRFVAGAVLLSAALACRKPGPAGTVRDTLVRHLDGDPATLDPITTTEEFGLLVVEMIFRPLVAIDRERRIAPGLAQSWKASGDGRTFTFALDPKARWEDGSAVTSEDVKFTLERIVDPKSGAANWSSALEDLERVETPDPQTARAIFRKAYAERLLAFNLPIVSAAAYRKDPKAVHRAPVGSGPYRLESWETNQKIVLARRSDVSEDLARFRRIVFRVIPDATVRFQAGSRGELDEFRVTRDQTAAIEKSPEFLAKNRLLKVPQFLEVIVLWNCHNALLQDPRVRRALALSWPRAEAALRLYPPEGARLVSGPYPAGAAENAADVAVPGHNPAAAGKLLDEAGWKLGPDGKRHRGGKTATVELLYPVGRIYANLAEILGSGYASVGVELTQRPLDWAAYTQRAGAGEFDVQLAARTFVPPNLDPYPFYHSTQGPPGGSNQGSYSDPEADRLMEAAQRELDDAKRLALYREIHRRLAANPPADFLWSAEQYWGVSKQIEGVELSPLGLFHFLPGPLGWRPAAAAPR